MTRNGTFIAIEGLDGAGKTTVIEALEEQLDITATSEPSEEWTGEQLRRALTSDTPTFTDFFLFMADRHFHIEELIKPEVEAGNVVVSDRFADSTRVYQPYQLGGQLKGPLQWIEQVMDPWNYPPDYVLYLDISVTTALERADEEEKYETREMLEAVKANYERVLDERRNNGDRPHYLVLDGEQPKSDVVRDALQLLEEVLNDE